GHPATNQDMTLAWVFGPAGASRVMKGLADNPNQPITNLVDASTLQANGFWLLNKQTGAPKTVGEIVAGLNTGSWASGGGTAGPTTPGTAPPNPLDLFGRKLDAWQGAQGKLLDRLEAMQKAYLQQTQPTMWDRLGDNFMKWAMLNNATQGNLHATMGGVLH